MDNDEAQPLTDRNKSTRDEHLVAFRNAVDSLHRSCLMQRKLEDPRSDIQAARQHFDLERAWRALHQPSLPGSDTDSADAETAKRSNLINPYNIFTIQGLFCLWWQKACSSRNLTWANTPPELRHPFFATSPHGFTPHQLTYFNLTMVPSMPAIDEDPLLRSLHDVLGTKFADQLNSIVGILNRGLRAEVRIEGLDRKAMAWQNFMWLWSGKGSGNIAWKSFENDFRRVVGWLSGVGEDSNALQTKLGMCIRSYADMRRFASRGWDYIPPRLFLGAQSDDVASIVAIFDFPGKWLDDGLRQLEVLHMVARWTGAACPNRKTYRVTIVLRCVPDSRNRNSPMFTRILRAHITRQWIQQTYSPTLYRGPPPPKQGICLLPSNAECVIRYQEWFKISRDTDFPKNGMGEGELYVRVLGALLEPWTDRLIGWWERGRYFPGRNGEGASNGGAKINGGIRACMCDRLAWEAKQALEKQAHLEEAGEGRAGADQRDARA